MNLRSLKLPIRLAQNMSGFGVLPAINPFPERYHVAPGATGVELTTHDNLKLFGQWWMPQGEPKAVVLLLHGTAAHAGLYYPWAQYLTTHGYAVFGYDLRSWGQSQGYGRPGYVRDYEEHVRDTTAAYQEVKCVCPDKPVFLQGESLGGVLAMKVGIDDQHRFQGLVLNAPGYTLTAFARLAFSGGYLFGKVWPNCPALPVGNKFIFNHVGKLIIHNPAVKQRVMEDPFFTHSAISAAYVTSLYALGRDVRANLGKIRAPFLVINGTRDKLVPCQSGDLLIKKTSAMDRTHKLYAGMSHCTLHDHGKEKVWADILAWMDARLPALMTTPSKSSDNIVQAVMTADQDPAQ